MTARSLSGVLRSRSSAAPLRLLGLGLILFGLLYTHAVSPDATVGHLASAEGVSAQAADASHSALVRHVASASQGHDATDQPSGGHGDHGGQHAFEECGLGQPSQGPEVDVPALSPLGLAVEDEAPHIAHVRPSAVRGFVIPIPHAAESPVLRI
ncbi:hypothetical protein [Streptomyces sp. MZ04]|uniref:hypothetical protein n=1 Tax=Streptomyces sp. MZ04 TaxID=2559236 RepID=UPI00107ED379|nr:hypothetical protein [Streptomyces sp. MZ04]TGB09389.1 hypothetical protein E2651_16475 [Streptomyces sp. MZ04]